MITIPARITAARTPVNEMLFRLGAPILDGPEEEGEEQDGDDSQPDASQEEPEAPLLECCLLILGQDGDRRRLVAEAALVLHRGEAEQRAERTDAAHDGPGQGGADQPDEDDAPDAHRAADRTEAERLVEDDGAFALEALSHVELVVPAAAGADPRETRRGRSGAGVALLGRVHDGECSPRFPEMSSDLIEPGDG